MLVWDQSFKTESKNLAIEPLGVSGVQSVAAEARIPIIGIGGVTSDTVQSIIAAGAYGVAVIGAVAGARNPTEAASSLYKAIQ